MAQPRSTLQGLYGSGGTVFPDNTSRLISEGDQRSFGQDVTESHFNLIDDALSGAQGFKPAISTITELKAIPTASVANGSHIAFRDTDSGDLLRVYELVAGTDAESSPRVIRPDDFDNPDNAKIWKLALSGGITQEDVDTSGSTITLDMASMNQKSFIGSDPIAAPADVSMDNDETAVEATFRFIISDVAGVLTFPSNFSMLRFVSDWDSGTQEWTPPDTGEYEARMKFNGVSWLMDIYGPYNIVT